MKRIALTLFAIFAISSIYAFDLDELDASLSMRAITKDRIDTISLKTRLIANDKKLVVFTHHSDCGPTNTAIKTLYDCGIMDSLITEDYHLIIISGGYPVLTNKSSSLGEIKTRIIEDFEIYYDIRQNCFSHLNIQTCPYLVLIENGVIRKEITGNTNLDLLFRSNNSDINQTTCCPKCNGTGKVKPNPKSGHPDEVVGICPMCGGSRKMTVKSNK